MKRVIIEDLDPVTIERLAAIAKKHGRSLPAELKHIIEAAVQQFQTLNEPDAKEAIASQFANTVAKTPEELGWTPGFFERTFGAWEGEPLVREPQGELPELKPLE